MFFQRNFYRMPYTEKTYLSIWKNMLCGYRAPPCVASSVGVLAPLGGAVPPAMMVRAVGVGGCAARVAVRL